jgi:uncharacterized membrane protein required for colicin V production
MLAFISIIVMLVVSYAYFREGLLTALTMLVNVILAGVVTFNFYEPLADLVDPVLQGTVVEGYEDFFFLTVLFAAALGFFRWATNSLANTQIEFPALLQQFGAGAAGLVTGYLVSGFLVCVLQTLPWHENFMEFQPRSAGEGGLRRLLPADRVWLAVMRHAGAYPFAYREVSDATDSDSPYGRFATFDRAGSFELRYLRYRRYTDARNPLPYLGEFDRVLKRP